MKSEELAAINERASASPSLGYAFTHYRQDVERLLQWAHAEECRIEILNQNRIGISNRLEEALEEKDRLQLQNREMTEDRDAWIKKENAASNRLVDALLEIEEKNRALFNIINVIGPMSAAKCEGCLFEMEEALRIARVAFEDKSLKREGRS